MIVKVNSTDFAECIRKLQPAVNVVKEKKEVTEGSIRFSINPTQKVEAGYVGIAVAFDGKKQLLCAFLMNEVEMEEKMKNIYLSGKKLYDIANVLDNGKDIPLTMTVDKKCMLQKGSSEVQMALGEESVIITPGNDWMVRATIKTKELLEQLHKGGRFYNSGREDVTDSVCIKHDIKNGFLVMSSSDTFKLSYYEKKVKYEVSKELEKKGKTPEQITHLIEGDQLKVLGKFLEDTETEIYVYENQMYLKSGSNIALFLTKDSQEATYPLDSIVNIGKTHTKTGKISILPQDIMDALNIFDAANQEEQPYVHVTQEKKGTLCFQTKGKTAKTLVHAEVEEKFKSMLFNSKILRMVLSNYNKDEKILIFTGEDKEVMLIKEKEDSNDFTIVTKLSNNLK